MATKDKNGNWLDGTGKAVPPKYVSPIDKRRDAMVERLFKKALRHQDALTKFKEEIWADVEEYLDWLAAQYGEKHLSPQGNYELKTFDGGRQIRVKVNKLIEFDEKLQLAKLKIDKCIESWSEGANDNLRVIIFDAFRTDQKGFVDTKRILGLRTLKIKDKTWKEAMTLIGEAITITGSRRYFHFQIRENVKAPWQTIRLDLAGV